MVNQAQFLDVIDRDEAHKRFRAALKLHPLGEESVAIGQALGRILAENVVARFDVPAFDRSNYDGYAVQAADTSCASEMEPRQLQLLPGAIEAGTPMQIEIRAEHAVEIATGGMLPRGADAVLMVEHADELEQQLTVHRAVTQGFGIAFAGTDICVGETVLRAGTRLTSRETGVLAALGEARVRVMRRPRVSIVSTGNELIAPGENLRSGCVFDSNSQVLADAVTELGATPVLGGIVRDELDALRQVLNRALLESDVVLLSGGTSKGQGDLCYRAVAELRDPGLIVHGVALKPGKPICLAVTAGKPVVVLPGFPTSAIFTFHEFVAPVIRELAGVPPDAHTEVQARMAIKTISDAGRTEFVLVGLVQTDDGLAAYPMGKGSGSVTAFGRADGFVTIPRAHEILAAGQTVQVRLLGRSLQLADLVVIGSHCVGLDYLLTQLQRRGWSSKLLSVGSSAGLQAVRRGECDVAGIHLLDPSSGTYNRPFIDQGLVLISGYRRSQGLIYRPDDRRFQGKTPEQIVATAISDPSVSMVNRNQGSGTRILIDRLLGGQRPTGYALQPSNHSGVAAAIEQRRGDWGMAIEAVAQASQLAFVPVQDEQFDFAIPKGRLHRAAVQAFLELLNDEATCRDLCRFKLSLYDRTG